MRQVIDSLPNLQEQGIEQLYPSGPEISDVRVDGTKSEWTLDRAFYLQKIAKSLLLNFLELVGILSVDPSQVRNHADPYLSLKANRCIIGQYGRKVEDLRTLFINAHHLLNEYRPHQARETLILMMEEQLQRSRAETEGIRQMKEKVEGILQDMAKDIDQAINSHGLIDQEEVGRGGKDAALREQRRVWETLRSELGASAGSRQSFEHFSSAERVEAYKDS